MAVGLIALGLSLILYVFLVLLGAVLWNLILNSYSRSLRDRRFTIIQEVLKLTVLRCIPLGALTVFFSMLIVSGLKVVLVPGGLSTNQSKLLLVLMTISIGIPTIFMVLRGRGIHWAQRADVTPALLAGFVAVLGVITTFLNRTTALAIFMGGGDHSNHVGRAVGILNAGAAGSVERLAILRPGGLNPLHYLVAVLFSSEGGTPEFAQSSEMYLFFARFEWLQLAIWVFAVAAVAQLAFFSLASVPKLGSRRMNWALVGCAVLGVVLMLTPFVGSVGLLGFTTSVVTAWLVLVPALLLSSRSMQVRSSLLLLLLVCALVFVTVISVRPADVVQIALLPAILLLALWTRRGRWKLKSFGLWLAALVGLIFAALGIRVLAPYIAAFISAGNPSGTSEELPFWLLVTFLLVVTFATVLRLKVQNIAWFWIWLWSALLGLLTAMSFLVIRFGSPPNDPDYLVSKGLFATAAIVIPVVAGVVVRIAIPILSRLKMPEFRLAMVLVPLSFIPLVGIDHAWQQALRAWAGEGHPMTWYSAPFARGVDPDTYPFSLKNRDAAWLAALTREAYSLPILSYPETIRPDPVYGAWYEMYLCKFIEENSIRVMVTDGFELQGALTDCPAAAGVSYIVPPRQAG